MPIRPTAHASTLIPGPWITRSEQDPLDLVTWVRRDLEIRAPDGGTVFRQGDVEVPEGWSERAANVVASRYFYGVEGTPEREQSVRTMLVRVVDAIEHWGSEQGLFVGRQASQFRNELLWLLVHQYASFNSPVWFNVGVKENPQCSACFINSVEDSLASIMALATTEALLFQHGSGTGTNFSPLRGSTEHLRGGGHSSGPVAFMRGFDAFAGVVKSGGRTRRAAKMVLLDADHPDIEAFVASKVEEESKAHALIQAGFDGSFDGDAYGSVAFQNANHSVRVDDAFMHAVAHDGPWELLGRVTGKPVANVSARALMNRISTAAHACGDPGLQYATTIDTWHTCKASGSINASNPCSEYMFLDDSACNLASLNVLKFLRKDGTFDANLFAHAASVLVTAQEILVDAASYPTERIAENSHRFRPLGLGYANLGSLLMSRGLPYDSDEGRGLAGAVTSLMGAAATRQSVRLAAARGPFEGFADNRDHMRDVVARHAEADAYDATVAPDVHRLANSLWREAQSEGTKHGFRNAQLTAIAPTGTISLMMDCDTTGIEPELALVKDKNLSGGGTLRLANASVKHGLHALGYAPEKATAIMEHLETHGRLGDAPGLARKHHAVFASAFGEDNGIPAIPPDGHLKMMAVAQPFVSGAISKTVNLPEETSVEEVHRIFVEGWKLGLKSVAVYRDNCKRIQPLVPARSQSDDLTMRCPECHNALEQSGTCYHCPVCGITRGCA